MLLNIEFLLGLFLTQSYCMGWHIVCVCVLWTSFMIHRLYDLILHGKKQCKSFAKHLCVSWKKLILKWKMRVIK